MKKIISGMIFRLIRGVEIWALIVMMIFASAYVFAKQMYGDQVVSAIRTGDSIVYEDETGAHSITPEDMRRLGYEGNGVSVSDIYKRRIETISAEAYEKLNEGYDFTNREIVFIFGFFSKLFLIPSILMMLFIPLFFGKIFSDHTIKNLIACGHSKAKIYLSSLFLTFAIDVILICLSIGIFAILCRYFCWKPPIYLPVVAAMILLQLFILFTITSIVLAVLFISSKKVASIIAGFILSIIPFMPISLILISALDNRTVISEDYKEWVGSKNNIDSNLINQRFDLKSFTVDYEYENNTYKTYEYKGSPLVTKALISAIYLDAFFLTHSEYIYMEPYMLYRDGLIGVYLASNSFWILLSTSVGILITRKKEVY